MSILFSPLTIRGIQLKNRIAVSPMCQYSAIDGFANDWHLVHLGSRAVGGAGLVIMEATAVVPEGRISPCDLGLWQDGQVEPLKRIVRFLEQQGCVPAIQLAHAGRKASITQPWAGDRLLQPTEGGWQTVAPSPIAFSENSSLPIELTITQIKEIVAAFQASTMRAKEAGFKIIELHGAHGYLINEFLSPLSNQRTDIYGGSFENRIRFLLEIIAAVRQVWAENLPLFLRISATEWVDNGWQVEDSVQLAGIVKDMGVDLIDCSTGGNIPNVKIPAKPGYQVPFAEEVRKTGILTGAVGIIVSPQQAEEILQQGKADLVFMARELLRNPYFPMQAATQLNEPFAWPLQYERAKRG